MARYITKRKEDIGLSPQALVFRGRKKTDNVRIRLWRYNNDGVQEEEITDVENIAIPHHLPHYLWLEVIGLHEVDEIKAIGDKFRIPPNILSDILDPNARPKVEEFESSIYLSLKILHTSSSKKLTDENYSLIIKDNVLISFQEREDDIFNPVKERLRNFNNKKIRTSGSDYLAFSLLDVVIDNYIYIMSTIGDKIEKLEESVYAKEIEEDFLNLIDFYKRELNYFRRQVKPAKEMILNFVKLDSDCIHEENEAHFRELQDNVKEASDLSDSYREILYDLLNIYHTALSTKLNDIMKVLTMFSVVFIPITFIVGLYGTNFEYLPEIHWKYGYFIMLGVCLLIAVSMLIYFKRKKWF